MVDKAAVNTSKVGKYILSTTNSKLVDQLPDIAVQTSVFCGTVFIN